MRSRLSLLAVAAVVSLSTVLAGSARAQATQGSADPERVRTLVHVLDYLAIDYPAAVANGSIIDTLEYAEMVEFAALADSLVREFERDGLLPDEAALSSASAELPRLVAGLVPEAELAARAGAVRDGVVAGSGIAVAPRRWPDIARGATLYAALCASCHGAGGLGDGPAGVNLDPAPAVLSEGDRIAGIAPFQAYNTVRLGVEGTGMLAFPQLSEEEVWDLAFFVKSLAHLRPADSTSVAAARRLVTLEEVSSLGDAELSALASSRGAADAGAVVAALRTAPPIAGDASSLDLAERLLASSLAAFRAGDAAGARQHAIAAYLQGIEPVEPILSARDPELVARLERTMMAVRAAVQGGQPPEVVAQLVAEAGAWIDTAREELADRNTSAWFTFWMAMSILLREALEAFLIILAMLGVVRATGQLRAARWIHAGWISAVLVGFAGWLAVDALLTMSAANRELMEGFIALVAVIVLLSVGFWMHDMTSARKWTAFLKERISRQLSTGNLIGLAAFAFFAVFREAFESVLFLAALGLEGGEHTGTALASATGATLVLVLVLGVAAVKYSARLPVRQLFRYASVLIAVLAVILAGKGMHSLQEAGLVSVTLVEASFRVELLGVYATMETLGAQAAVLAAILVLVLVTRRSHARLAVAA